MPDYPPLLRLPSPLAVLKEFLPTFFTGLSSSWTTFLDESWTAVKDFNLIGLLDAVVRFVTRLPYQTHIAFVNSVGRVLIANAAYYRRFVVKGDDVVRFMVKNQVEIFTQAGQLGASDVFDLVLGWLVQMGWAVVMKSSLLHKIFKLAKINSYEQLFKYFKTGALKNLWLTVVRVLLVYWALAYTMISFVIIGAFFHKWFEAFALAQDSKRSWRKKGGVHRVNRRRGKDS